MQNYTVRSTYTKADSAARRAADVIVTLFLSALLVFGLFYLVWRPVRVDRPLVEGLEDGDIVLVDRVAEYFTGYEVGDLVRAKIGDRIDFYRVVAMDGCEVIVREGNVYVDGALLKEPYAKGMPADIDAVYTVGKSELMLLPDDRSGLTARDIYLGIMNIRTVNGEVRFRIFPIKKLSVFN